MGAELEMGSINSRNDIESYKKMEEELAREICKQRLKEVPEKKGSHIRTPKSKPIDKKNFLNNIQNEIQVGDLD